MLVIERSFRSNKRYPATDLGSTACLLQYTLYKIFNCSASHLKWAQQKGERGGKEEHITVEATSYIKSDILIKHMRKHLLKLHLCQNCLGIFTQH